jgi:small-conductance mechanosensitive channel
LAAARLDAQPAAESAAPRDARKSPSTFGGAAARLSEALPAEHAAPIVFGNRTLTTLRARVLTHTPTERAQAARQRLDDLVARGVTGPVDRRIVEDLVSISVAGNDVFSIVPADVDELLGETLDSNSRGAARELERALGEAAEAHSPDHLLVELLISLAATGVFALAILLLVRMHRAAAGWCSRQAAAQIQRRLGRSPTALELLSPPHVIQLTQRLVGGASLLLGTLAVYAWLTYVLREFPYTRPWGESLGGFVFATLRTLALALLSAIPGLFAVALIFLLLRIVTGFIGRLFRAVEAGQIALPGVHPDTSQATRRLIVALLWVFALVASYPYLPGSQSDAFKGISVFVGLMISLGSSGLVNQMMSSLVIVYSRSLRAGEFVRIGDVEGTVLHLGALSTKLRTLWNEEVTLPNTVVASSTTTNYSRREKEGVLLRTSVTIGYDTPWRQVEALLLKAAARTPGVCETPRPAVVQVGLKDFYVAYDLLVSFRHQEHRLQTFDELHRNIQDAFNEHGVQIMSPNYMLDPKTPKLVRPEHWFDAPAKKPE